MATNIDQNRVAQAAEDRDNLFEMIAELAALANGRGEKAMAVMLTAIVAAYHRHGAL